MKVFVAGATGVIGRRALPRLLEAGHSVTGLARSDENDKLITSFGATAQRVDLFNPDQVGEAVSGHDAVINLASKIPPPSKAAFSGAWKESTRIRSEGVGNLVDAAIEAGAQKFIQESIAFIYPDRGTEWIDEDVPLNPPKLGLANQAAEKQAERFAGDGRETVVLRFGQFYAWEAVHTQYVVSMIRRRMPGMPGPSSSYRPAIAVDDAASAAVAALAVPGGTYNITDDDPLTGKEFNKAIADALGVKPPFGSGALMIKFLASTRFFGRSLRVSNARFKEVSDWTPEYPNARDGWAAMVANNREDN